MQNEASSVFDSRKESTRLLAHRGGLVRLDSFSEFLGDDSLVRLPVLVFLV